MITKKEAIEYFENHREDLFELCKKFDLKFPYENREELFKYYHALEEMKERFKEKSLTTQYLSVCNEIRDLEKTYHLFDPKFDERSENRWIPEEFNESAHNIFEFRKEVFSTQSIWHDCELNKTISQDIWSLWDEKGGQDGMYKAFPFTCTKESIVREKDYYSDYLKTNIHYTTKLIRSYYLSGSGGLAIVEERIYSHFSDMTHVRKSEQDSYKSSFKIVTLGEDDANLFLMGRCLYEGMMCDGKKEFIESLGILIKEYESHN